MKSWAAVAMAARPIAGAARLIVSEPSSAKNSATRWGSWLHQAAV